MSQRNLDKAALRGEPSYVWRAGQQRRFEMIVHAAGKRLQGYILENGCGVGMYVEHIAPLMWSGTRHKVPQDALPFSSAILRKHHARASTASGNAGLT